jgi:hypothetical protein
MAGDITGVAVGFTATTIISPIRLGLLSGFLSALL